MKTYQVFVAVLVVLTISQIVMAQDDLPIEVDIVPQADVASIGSQFSYTVIVTNTSNIPVNEVIVSATIPDGADFVSADSTWIDWAISKSLAYEPGGRVIWIASQAMPPQDVVTFELVVDVADDFVGQTLINKAFVVIGQENLFEERNGSVVDIVVATPTLDLSTPTPNREEVFQTKEAYRSTSVAQQTVGASDLETRQAVAQLTLQAAPATDTPTVPPPTVANTSDTPVVEPTQLLLEEQASSSLFCCFSSLILVSLFSCFVVYR